MASFLRRYTNLPALIYLLRARASWDDKNDSYFLSPYRQKRDLKSVLALCFTPAFETYHHWRVFAEGSSGICITFDQEKLLGAMKKQPGVTARSVKYLTLNDIRDVNVRTRNLPFLKRSAYGDEREFRIIYVSSDEEHNTLNIDVPLSCIERITLSPWIPSMLADHVKSTIKEIEGCGSLRVFRSTLISNETWKELGESAD